MIVASSLYNQIRFRISNICCTCSVFFAEDRCCQHWTRSLCKYAKSTQRLWSTICPCYLCISMSSDWSLHNLNWTVNPTATVNLNLCDFLRISTRNRAHTRPSYIELQSPPHHSELRIILLHILIPIAQNTRLLHWLRLDFHHCSDISPVALTRQDAFDWSEDAPRTVNSDWSRRRSRNSALIVLPRWVYYTEVLDLKFWPSMSLQVYILISECILGLLCFTFEFRAGR